MHWQALQHQYWIVSEEIDAVCYLTDSGVPSSWGGPAPQVNICRYGSPAQEFTSCQSKFIMVYRG